MANKVYIKLLGRNRVVEERRNARKKSPCKVSIYKKKAMKRGGGVRIRMYEQVGRQTSRYGK